MTLQKKNKFRSRYFGLVINPNQPMDWKDLSVQSIELKLVELAMVTKDQVCLIMDNFRVENTNKNLTKLSRYVGQLELGKNSKIPHYQMALEFDSICYRNKVLEALQHCFPNNLIQIDVQYNFAEMVKYCTKPCTFISENFSGVIGYKYSAGLKPEYKFIAENLFPWQKFLMEEILNCAADNRIIDWCIDVSGNSGKSTYARFYVAKYVYEALLVKIDNIDRMELAIIEKIQYHRELYQRDPSVIFFDFPRAVDTKKVVSATALMEDLKGGYLETSFGGRHKEIHIENIHVVVFSNAAPDISLLSMDRWRLWNISGREFGWVMWPCKLIPVVIDFQRTTRLCLWNVEIVNLKLKEINNLVQYKNLELNSDWLKVRKESDKRFRFKNHVSRTKLQSSMIFETPNHIRIILMERYS